MRKVWRSVSAAAALGLVGFGPQSHADTGFVLAQVQMVFVSNDARWGGCMALLSVDPQTVLPACGGHYVTFGCEGDFMDPVRAYRMLDQAQLALATGKYVGVTLQDDKKYNGYCLANRIDVWR